tara:strand:- start:1463 stop:1858 length:396 start_codon:yes stop_codon:yes gene_type:complete
MDKEFKKLEMSVTRSNIVIEWKEYKVPAGLQYSPEMIMQKESEQNGICKVLAVGEDVKNIKPGDLALMGGVGRLITLNDTTYGIVKEHMIDAVFGKMPKVGVDEGESQGTIMTDLTQKQLDRFGEKHSYKA